MDQDRSGPPSLVSLEEHRLARRHPAVVQVEAYWEALKGSRLVPDRAEVDPRGLAGALEHAFVLERIAPGLARFRVAGMHLSDLMGLEVRGMPISATFVPEARPELSRALEAAFNEPARVRLVLDGETGIGRPGLQGEMLLLPLRADGGEVSRVLGALAMEGGVGRQPRRLSITALEHKTLTGYAGTDRIAAPRAPHHAPRSFAVDGAAGPAKRSPHGVPFLRLVHSRD